MNTNDMRMYGVNPSWFNTDNGSHPLPGNTSNNFIRAAPIDRGDFPAKQSVYSMSDLFHGALNGSSGTGQPAPARPYGSVAELESVKPSPGVQWMDERGHPQQVETRLIFGLGPAETPELGVSEDTWDRFHDSVVRRHFPDARSIDAYGQWQWKDGRGIARQHSKILVIDHPDTPENRVRIQEIRNEWVSHFNQESVMETKYGGDKSVQGAEDNGAPKWLETRLAVDLNLPEESISEPNWRGFVDTEITRRFPDGLTEIVPDEGETSRRGFATRRSKEVIIAYPDTPENRAKVEEIRGVWKAYSGNEMRSETHKVQVSF